MPALKTSCVYRRNMFFGTYDVRWIGADEVVCVQYNGATWTTRSEGFPLEAVAESLLMALVLREVTAARALDTARRMGVDDPPAVVGG